jgi:hypothetical protein
LGEGNNTFNLVAKDENANIDSKFVNIEKVPEVPAFVFSYPKIIQC